MWCPDKLKLNKFQHEHVPSNAEYFRRNGEVAPPPGLGDEMPKSHTSVGEQMKDMEKWVKTKQAEDAARQAEEERKKREAEEAEQGQE